MVWVGLGGFAWLLAHGAGEEVPRWRRAFDGGGRGLFFGATANAIVLRFVPQVVVRFTPLPWSVGVLALLLLSVAEGLRWVVAAVVTRALVRRGAPLWLAFTVGVYAGTFVPVVFPWNPGGGLSPWPVFVQLAELVGERGVTAMLAAAAGLGAQTVALARAGARRRAVLVGAVAVMLPALTALEGWLRLRHLDADLASAARARVALVQPATEARERWEPERAPAILDRLAAMTRHAEARGVNLTVWPEAAFPYALPASATQDLWGPFAILQPGVRGPVLTGVMMELRGEGSYNSAVVALEGGKLTAPYHKQHLLWFGETVPFADVSPWVRRTFSRGTGILPGEKQVLQRIGPIRAAVLNCFEDILPEAAREAMAAEGGPPNLLVNVTNDAWFFGSVESELHLRMAALRSVETRRDLVRAVNRGPTSWVDAGGRVRAKYDLDVPGFLVAEPALVEWAPTPYARFGDAPLGTLLALVSTLVVRRARRALQSTFTDAQKAKGAPRHGSALAPVRPRLPAEARRPALTGSCP
jgi:apolipoprotein N-acyltransferase